MGVVEVCSNDDLIYGGAMLKGETLGQYLSGVMRTAYLTVVITSDVLEHKWRASLIVR